MTASGLFVVGSAVVGGAIATSAMDIFFQRGAIDTHMAHALGRPTKIQDYVPVTMAAAGQLIVKEVLTVLPPAYALLYYLGHVGHAKQTMSFAK